MEAIKLLPPAMVKGFQGISLMSMPDVLQSSAVPARARIPYSWFRDKFCFIEDLKQKIINREYDYNFPSCKNIVKSSYS